MNPGDPVWLRYTNGHHVLDAEGLPVTFQITAVDAIAATTWYRLATDHPTAHEIFSGWYIRHRITPGSRCDAGSESTRRGRRRWSRADFQCGDFAKYRGSWYEVLRVNNASVTIPHLHLRDSGGVVRAGDVRPGWTWTAPYDGLAGRMSAEAMRQQQGATDLSGRNPA
ncbi:hypothetical protein [Streptomyces chrestomyceticus]|uniref:hypothetical protein n=1 Tax=Streptomyces chrestomyceticus TaxID=68185 RepID=UPI0033F926A4